MPTRNIAVDIRPYNLASDSIAAHALFHSLTLKRNPDSHPKTSMAAILRGTTMLVGVVVVVPMKPTAMGMKRVKIEALGVSKDLQKYGIGSRLMETVINRWPDRSITLLPLPGATGFYRKLGFVSQWTEAPWYAQWWHRVPVVVGRRGTDSEKR